MKTLYLDLGMGAAGDMGRAGEFYCGVERPRNTGHRDFQRNRDEKRNKRKSDAGDDTWR